MSVLGRQIFTAAYKTYMGDELPEGTLKGERLVRNTAPPIIALSSHPSCPEGGASIPEQFLEKACYCEMLCAELLAWRLSPSQAHPWPALPEEQSIKHV